MFYLKCRKESNNYQERFAKNNQKILIVLCNICLNIVFYYMYSDKKRLNIISKKLTKSGRKILVVEVMQNSLHIFNTLEYSILLEFPTEDEDVKIEFFMGYI